MTQWRKSTHNQEEINTECVEVSANTTNATLIRDSKDPGGARLSLTRSEFANLIGTLKAGGYKV
ncbi:DUF397 domain-containing protein [Actinomadura rugatobispora]|uniref:DUF397 domain-containing protein n=1 Tax=Actinomadura rugatobispora TaxID=1994 RepID=A0ABW0ZW76_9ACTN|nr:hypothetical protein GCM10010200_017000 [Actinomadura rugatobispora]